MDIYALNLFIEHSGEQWWEQNAFCSFTTPQAFRQSSAPGALSTVVTSVVLYSLTRATPMSAGKDETRVSGYINSEFIHWALSRTLMRTGCFSFVHHTTSILAKLSSWCSEHSVTSVVLYSSTRASLMSPGKDETYIYNIYIYIYIYIYIKLKICNRKNRKLPMAHCCQNSSLVLSLFKNIFLM